MKTKLPCARLFYFMFLASFSLLHSLLIIVYIDLDFTKNQGCHKFSINHKLYNDRMFLWEDTLIEIKCFFILLPRISNDDFVHLKLIGKYIDWNYSN